MKLLILADMLHSLVEHSTRFEREIDKKDRLLDEAREEIHKLRRRIRIDKGEEEEEV